MLEDFSEVGDIVHGLLLQSGFCEELFFLKIEWNKVIILFDKKEAVDYFESDFKLSEISSRYVYSYEKDGKRHAAVITRRNY